MLYSAISSGVECKNGNSSAWLKTTGRKIEKLIENFKFIIDGDAQCLKAALQRFCGLLFASRVWKNS
jgi:hypothetical protein